MQITPEIAAANLAEIVADLKRDAVGGAITADGGSTEVRAVRYTLSGGGPSADVTVVYQDRYLGRVDVVIVNWWFGGQDVRTMLTGPDAERIAAALDAGN